MAPEHPHAWREERNKNNGTCRCRRSLGASDGGSKRNTMKRIILSGGGTGGHIYPAVAVAEALRRRFGEEVELLFVGAEGKMEMEKVPALGYRIVGLPIAGLQRRLEWRNLLVPFKVLRSIRQARNVIRSFGADVVVGFGGYASAPVLWAAQRMGVPTVIQEQNSYAGVTNKILARGACRICTAYEGMERFFPKEKIVLTGNPLRGRFSKSGTPRAEALDYFGFTPGRKVVLVVGGSLGTRSLNEMMKTWLLSLGGGEAPVQVIWQTGKYYEREMQAFLAAHPVRGIWQGAFIERMDYFDAHGCRSADHGLDEAVYREASETELEAIYAKALAGEKVTKAEQEAYQTALLLLCGAEYAKRGWVWQIHYSCLRNPNSRMFAKLGPDMGFDSMNEAPGASALARLLDTLDHEEKLPKTILYSLNPGENEMLDALIGAFQGPEIPGKIQHGSAWWFNDTESGMRAHLTSLANLSILGNFVGMLTDSRSLLSYARHEYFRRVLCDWIGNLFEHGEYHCDLPQIERIVRGVCYENAKLYFNL